MPERGPINQYEILDYAVRKNHIATGEVSYKKLDEDHGTKTAVPSADTEVAHNLGKTPTKVELTEKAREFWIMYTYLRRVPPALQYRREPLALMSSGR